MQHNGVVLEPSTRHQSVLVLRRTWHEADDGGAAGVIRGDGPLALDLSGAHGTLLDHDVDVDLGRVLGRVHLLRVHLQTQRAAAVGNRSGMM